MINIVVINERLWEDEDLQNILVSLPDVKLCGSGQDDYYTVKLVSDHKPDILLLDSRLNAQIGANILPLLRSRSPSTAIMLLIPSIDGIPVHWMLDNTFAAYILRDMDLHHIGNIIREVHVGGRYINPTVARTTFNLLANKAKAAEKQAARNRELRKKKTPPRQIKLSSTEQQIFAHIAKGKSNSEIAESLGLKNGTVRNYVSSGMRKAGLKNRIQIALYAIEYGITETSV
jgi:DNA-binding NarL/FixJ family response regulator